VADASRKGAEARAAIVLEGKMETCGCGKIWRKSSRSGARSGNASSAGRRIARPRSNGNWRSCNVRSAALRDARRESASARMGSG
jgi:hypothetical protein